MVRPASADAMRIDRRAFRCVATRCEALRRPHSFGLAFVLSRICASVSRKLVEHRRLTLHCETVLCSRPRKEVGRRAHCAGAKSAANHRGRREAMVARLANSSSALLVVAIALSPRLAVAQHAEVGHAWSYEGEYGPAKWGDLKS